MQFTDTEMKFLMETHRVEHATGRRELRDMVDLRRYGCPEYLFSRILEQRARQIGLAFAEFRSRQNSLRAEQSARIAQPDLGSQIAAARLF